MKTAHNTMIKFAFIAATVFAVVAAELPVAAQTYWLLSYRGTETTANAPEDATQLVTARVTENDLVERAAAAAGGVRTSNLVLVLSDSADALRDKIQVVDRTDPNVFRVDVLKLFFSEGYTNSSGTLSRRFQYVFMDTEHSQGSAIVTRRSTNRNGQERVSIQGDVQFWSPHTNGRVLSQGVFTASRTLDIP